MNLEVSRSGGFAGMRLSGSVEVDESVHERLAALPPHEPRPDRFVYQLTMGEQSVTVGEQDLPDDLRELVARALASA